MRKLTKLSKIFMIKVSVMIPIYNAEKYLRGAVLSVLPRQRLEK